MRMIARVKMVNLPAAGFSSDVGFCEHYWRLNDTKRGESRPADGSRLGVASLLTSLGTEVFDLHIDWIV